MGWIEHSLLRWEEKWRTETELFKVIINVDEEVQTVLQLPRLRCGCTPRHPVALASPLTWLCTPCVLVSCWPLCRLCRTMAAPRTMAICERDRIERIIINSEHSTSRQSYEFSTNSDNYIWEKHQQRLSVHDLNNNCHHNNKSLQKVLMSLCRLTDPEGNILKQNF